MPEFKNANFMVAINFFLPFAIFESMSAEKKKVFRKDTFQYIHA